MELRLGTEGDLEGWMELAAKVKDAFPGLETRAALEAHRETALGFMRRGEENELFAGGTRRKSWCPGPFRAWTQSGRLP